MDVYISDMILQHDNYTCKFCDLHPPCKFKINNMTQLLIVGLFPL